MQGCTWLYSGWEPVITVSAPCLFRLLVATQVLSATQACKQALRVLTGVFCDCADLLPQVLLAFPHAVARRHAQGHHNLAVSQR